MGILGYTILTLVVIGVISAAILWVVAWKFRVDEDPRIDEVEKMLPGANCGGCGFAGCRAFAGTVVASDEMGGLFCPVGGSETMKTIASYLGRAAVEREPQVAVVRCGGSWAKRERTNVFDGAPSCAVSASLYAGETGCVYGCIGKGDCVEMCQFGALTMNAETGLPIVDAEKCTACGACAKRCPKGIIELRNKGKRDMRVWVSCINRDKGAVAMKACKAACIACGKCVKVCAFEAIKLENNIAYINFETCKLCRKCVAECPTGAILENGFPAKKETANQQSAISNLQSQSVTSNP